MSIGSGRGERGASLAARGPGPVEFLLTNHRGSFALGMSDRVPRRKYHGLLTVRDPGRGDPWNVLAEVGEELSPGDPEPADEARILRLHAFDFGAAPSPLGAETGAAPRRDPAVPSARFARWPTPTFRYELDASSEGEARGEGGVGVSLARSVALDADEDCVRLTYTVTRVARPTRLRLIPWLRCRPLHALTRENAWLDGRVTEDLATGSWAVTPYPSMPSVHLRVSGLPARFEASGCWYRNVHYAWEQARGYDAEEDLFVPGSFVLELTEPCVVSMDICAGRPAPTRAVSGASGRDAAQAHAAEAATEPSFQELLERAGDQFFMRLREGGLGVVAGYPWFGEWGRDTLLALPGLCLARGRWAEARELLQGLAARRVNGLIANLPASAGTPANANSVDASLLFARAVRLLAKAPGGGEAAPFMPVVCELLDALAGGADPRIWLVEPLSLFTRRGPWALTWMDALIDGAPVTPRDGHAVELDALLLEAVAFALPWAAARDRAWHDRWAPRLAAGRGAFVARYWQEAKGFLADGHDGRALRRELRPNQLFALASPTCPLDDGRAVRALAAVRQQLLTTVGLRTLGPEEPAYRGGCEGTQAERDRAYHQGTAWPWLLGLYADAVERLHGAEACRRELAAPLGQLEARMRTEGCVGQLAEIYDGDEPHHPRGAPAQAWSVAEVYRVARRIGFGCKS